jgi:hypothetical protein
MIRGESASRGQQPHLCTCTCTQGSICRGKVCHGASSHAPSVSGAARRGTPSRPCPRLPARRRWPPRPQPLQRPSTAMASAELETHGPPGLPQRRLQGEEGSGWRLTHTRPQHPRHTTSQVATLHIPGRTSHSAIKHASDNPRRQPQCFASTAGMPPAVQRQELHTCTPAAQAAHERGQGARWPKPGPLGCLLTSASSPWRRHHAIPTGRPEPTHSGCALGFALDGEAPIGGGWSVRQIVNSAGKTTYAPSAWKGRVEALARPTAQRANGRAPTAGRVLDREKAHMLRVSVSSIKWFGASGCMALLRRGDRGRGVPTRPALR